MKYNYHYAIEMDNKNSTERDILICLDFFCNIKVMSEKREIHQKIRHAMNEKKE